MKCLIWRALRDRLPSKANLARRNIIVNPTELLCPFCNHHIESLNHIFISSPLASDIWSSCYSWMPPGFAIVCPSSLKSHCWLHFGLGRNSTEQDIWWVIWASVMFSVWKSRNASIYKRAVMDRATLLHEVRFLCWLCMHDSIQKFKFSFVQWYSNPAACIASCIGDI